MSVESRGLRATQRLLKGKLTNTEMEKGDWRPSGQKKGKPKKKSKKYTKKDAPCIGGGDKGEYLVEDGGPAPLSRRKM